MDENFIKQRVKKYCIRLKPPFGANFKSYFDKFGVQIVEHLKHLEKENWDFVTIEIIELKFILISQLKTAVDLSKVQVR